MPKFNDFIKTFEEKETAPKVEEPKDKGTPQTPARTFKPLSKAEAEDMRKGGFTEDEYRYNQAKDYAIAMGEEMPDKRQFMQELGEWKEANKQKAEEPNSLEYEGYRLEKTPDGKWINRDTYEYFDSKVEAQKDIDNFIAKTKTSNWQPSEEEKSKEARLQRIIDERVKRGWDMKGTYDPQAIKDTGYLGFGSLDALEENVFGKDNEKGQRIVNYGGKDMTFEEAKELYKKAVAIPTLKSTPEREAYLDKSAEYDIAQDELYKKWYEEKDPQKKAELKEQMDNLDKEYARFLNEWEEAERNRYKKD